MYDFIRGLRPYPGAWTTLRDTNGKDTVLKIFKSECSGKGSNFAPGRIVVDNKDMYVTAKDGLLKIIELQLAGKKRMAARDFLNGIKNMTEYQCIRSESSV